MLEDADDQDVYLNEPLLLPAPLSVLAQESSVTACAALDNKGAYRTELLSLPAPQASWSAGPPGYH